MKKKNDIKKELRAIAPFLEHYKEKEEGFRVPENYFLTLPDEILGQIKRPTPTLEPASDNQPAPLTVLLGKLQLLLRPRVAWAMASITALILVGLLFLLPRQETHNAYFSNISNNELNSYILSNIDEFELNTFVETGLDDLDFDLEKEAMDNEIDKLIEALIEDVEISELEELL